MLWVFPLCVVEVGRVQELHAVEPEAEGQESAEAAERHKREASTKKRQHFLSVLKLLERVAKGSCF